MKIATEHINEKKVTSQYWGFRELNEDELMLISGGYDADGDDAPQPDPLPTITVYANSPGTIGISTGSSVGSSNQGSSPPVCTAPPPPPPPPKEPDNCLNNILGGGLVGAATGNPVLAIITLTGAAVAGGCIGPGGWVGK